MQYNNLIALFDNWDSYVDTLEVANNAQGTLQEQQDIYMESTAAHLQQLETASEGVFDSLLDADTINTVADGLTTIVTGIESFVDSMGGGLGILQVAAPLLANMFSEDIANEVVRITNNIDAANQNVATMQQKLEGLRQFQEAGSTDPNTLAFLQQEEDVLVKLSSSMSTSEINEFGKRMDELNSKMSAYATSQEEVNQVVETYKKALDNQDITFDQIISSSTDYLAQLEYISSAYNVAIEPLEEFINTNEDFNEWLNAFDDFSASGDINEYVNELDNQLKQAINFDDLKANLSNGVTNEIENAFTTLNEALLNSEGNTNSIDTAFKNFNDTLKQLGVNMQEVSETDLPNLNQNAVKAKNEFDQIKESIQKSTDDQVTKQMTQSVVGITTELIGMATSVTNLVSNMKDIWSDNSLSGWQKLGKTILSISGNASAFTANILKAKKDIIAFAASIEVAIEEKNKQNTTNVTGTVVENANAAAMDRSRNAATQLAAAETTEAAATGEQSAANAIESGTEVVSQASRTTTSGITSINAALTSLKASAAAAGTSLGAIATIAGGVVIGIAAVSAAIYVAYKASKRFEEAVKSANTIYNTNAEILKEIKSEYEELKESLEDYNEAYSAIEDLTKGTEEWKEQVTELNEQVLDLIENYPELAKYVSNQNGVLTISEEGQEALLEAQQKKVSTAQLNTYSSAYVNKGYSIESANKELQNSLNKSNISVQTTDISGTLSSNYLTDILPSNLKEILISSAKDGYSTLYDQLGIDLSKKENTINGYTIETSTLTEAIAELVNSNSDLIASIDNLEESQSVYAQEMANEIYDYTEDKTKSDSYNEAVSTMLGDSVQKQLDEIGDSYDDYLKYLGYDKGDDDAVHDAFADYLQDLYGSDYTVKEGGGGTQTGGSNFKIINNKTGETEMYSEENVSDEAMARILANQEAIKKLSENAEGNYAKIIEDLNTIYEKNENLVDFAGGKSGVDLSSLTQGELNDFKEIQKEMQETLLKGSDEEKASLLDEAKSLGFETAEAYMYAVNNSVSQQEIFETAFKNSLTPAVKTALNNLNLDDTSLNMREQIADILTNAFQFGGQAGLDSATKVLNNLGDLTEENLSAIADFDFGFSTWEQFKTVLEEQGIEVEKNTKAWQDYYETISNAVNKSLTISETVEKANAAYTAASGIKTGSEIKDEDYQTLIESAPELQDQFKQLADGKWMYIGTEDLTDKILKLFDNVDDKVEETKELLGSLKQEGFNFDVDTSSIGKVKAELDKLSAEDFESLGTNIEFYQSQVEELVNNIGRYTYLSLKSSSEELTESEKEELEDLESKVKTAEDYIQSVYNTALQKQEDYNNKDEQLQQVHNTEIINGVKELADLRQKYLSGQITEDEYNEWYDYALNLDLTSLGYDKDTFDSYVESLQATNDSLKNNKQAAEDLALANIKMNSSIKTLSSSWSTYKVDLAAGAGSSGYAEAMQGTKEALADILGTSVDNITDQFVIDNQELIDSLVEGDGEAIDKLQDKFNYFADYVKNAEVFLTLGIDDDDAQTKTKALIEQYKNLILEGTLRINPDTGNLEGIADLLQLLAKAGVVASEDVEKVLSSLGIKRTAITAKVATGVDGNGNVVYSDKIVDYKYETINKTNSGSAAYNASNASSSSSSTSSVDLDQSVIDKYEDLDNAIDVLKDKLSDLQDAQDDLFGDELIDNLKQQKEAIEEITKATQKEISAMTAGQKTEQAYLKNQGVTFDSEGNITNAAEIKQQKQDEYNKAVEAYNANPTTAGKENLSNMKDANDALDDRIDTYTKTNTSLRSLTSSVNDYNKQQKELDKAIKDAEIEEKFTKPLETLDTAIDILKDKLSDLQAQQENLFGDDLIENLQKQKELTEEIAEATQKRLDAMKQDQGTYQKELENTTYGLQGEEENLGIIFDEDGNITNLTDVKQKLDDEYNAVLKDYQEKYKNNEDSAEAQAQKARLEAMREQKEVIEDNLDTYNETQDSIRSLSSDMIEYTKDIDEYNKAIIEAEVDKNFTQPLEKLDNQLQQVSNDLEVVNEELDNYNREIDRIDKKIDDLDITSDSAEIVELLNKRQELEEKSIESLEKQKELLEEQKELQNNRLTSLQKQQTWYDNKLKDQLGEDVYSKLRNDDGTFKNAAEAEELGIDSETYQKVKWIIDEVNNLVYTDIPQAKKNIVETDSSIEDVNDSLDETKDKLDSMDLAKAFKKEHLFDEVDAEIDSISRKISNLSKASSKLTGNNLIANLKQQQALIDQEIAAYEKKKKLAKEQAALDLQGLKNSMTEFGIDSSIIKLNEEGLIINAAEIVMQAASAGLAEEKVEALEKYIEEYNDFISQITDIDSSILDLQFDKADLEQDIKDAAQEALDKLVAKFNAEIDVRLNLNDAEREWNEWRRHAFEGLRDEDIYGTIVGQISDAYTYYDSISALSSHLYTIMDQINQINATGTSSLYGKDIESALSDLTKYREEMMSQAEALQDLVESAEDAYDSMIDKIADKLSDQLSQYQRINDIIEHDMNLVKLLKGDDSYKELATYYEQQEKNNNAQAAFLKEQMEYWKSKMASVEVGSDAWEKYKENYTSAQDELNSLLEESIQTLIDKYQNAIEEIFQELEDKVTNGLGLEYIGDEWDLINKNADQYLDKIDAMYEIQTLQNKFLESINNTTDLKAQQKLTDVMNEQLDILKEKENVSQYDVDRANMMYEIALKQIALEEAQQNKSQMRLRRDSQGNYTYQYVADEDKISDAQNELLEAQNNLYNLDKDKYKENLNDIYDLYQEFEDKLKELYSDTTLSDEEREKQKALLITQYGNLINNLVADNETIRQNLQSSTFDMLASLYDTDIQNFQNLSDAEKNILMNDMIPQWDSGVQEMIDIFAGSDGLAEMCKKALEDLGLATDDYKKSLSDLEDAAGVDFDSIVDDGIDPTIEETQKLIDINEDLINTYEEQAKSLATLIEQLKNTADYYNQLADAAVSAATAMESANAGATNAEDNTSSSTTSGSTSGGSSSGSSSSDSDDSSSDTKKYRVKVTEGVIGYKTVKKDGTTKDRVKAKVTKYRDVLSKVTMDADGDVWYKVKGIQDNDSMTWYVQKNDVGVSAIESYDTGGYTGDWNSTNGKMAMLHEKELVLNKADTANILSAVNTVRDMGSVMSALQSILGSQMLNALSSISNYNVGDTSTSSSAVDQNVKIEATFPNVTNSNEIQDAFNNLINRASQYAFNTKR